MRGKRAKAIRHAVYGDLSTRASARIYDGAREAKRFRFFRQLRNGDKQIVSTGTLRVSGDRGTVARGKRREYQAAKRRWKRARQRGGF